MRAHPALFIVCAVACKRAPPPPPDEGRAQRPRVDVTVAVDPVEAAPPEVVVVRSATPPAERELHSRGSLRLAVVGLPDDGELRPMLDKLVPDAEFAGSNGTVLVTKRCLKDVQAAMEKNLLPLWTVAAVVGAPCQGGAKRELGAAVFVEGGKPSRVTVTFDRATGAFLKVAAGP